jgi:glycosyltransferase involved in cell wall biosynthesis
MQLSIVIPTFNEEVLLPRLLASIAGQSFKDYEIIIADNHSTDNTLNIAKQYNAIIVDGGMPGKSRNAGAAIAKGDAVLFLDADVVLAPNFLQDIISEFHDKRYGVATCQITPMSSRKIDTFIHGCYNWLLILSARVRPFAPGFCIIANRQIHMLLNGFDESIMLGEDSDYAYRAGKITRFGLLRSHRIQVSVRRFDRDGRWNVSAKYILSGIYMLVFGRITTDLFHYTFGHSK